jgi:fatty acid desaturase
MTEKWHRQGFAQDASRLADKAFLKQLKTYAFGDVAMGTVVIWAQITAGWALALLGNVWLSLGAFVLFISAQQHLASWVHESSHLNLFRSRKLNDLWCNFFFGAPIGMDLAIYRANHLTHHAYLSSDEDRDRHVHAVDLTGINLWKELAKSLVCYYGFKVAVGKYLCGALGSRAQRVDAPSSKAAELNWLFLAMAAFWNLFFLILCVGAGRWYLYFALWIYPLFSVAQFINILRTSAEHQPVGYPSVELDDPAIVRTTLPNPLERWLMYGVNFNYHVEHHLWPQVPFFNLPKLHAHLVKSGFYKRHPDLLQRSGIARVWEISRHARATANLGR